MKCTTPPVLNLLCLNNSFSLETNKNIRQRTIHSKNFLKQRILTMKLHRKQFTQNKLDKNFASERKLVGVNK